MNTYAYAICGRIASGKSIVSRSLAQRHEWDMVSFGDFVRITARKKGLGNDRETLQDLGSRLFAELGPVGILEAARSVCRARSEVQVIDGIRHVDVWNAARAAYDGAALLYLESPLEQRYHRYCSRHGLTAEAFSLADFTRLDRQPIETGIDTLRPHAEAIINADLSMTTFIDEIDRLVARNELRRG